MQKCPAYALCAATLFGQDFKLDKIAGFATGVFDRGAAGIAAGDPSTKQLFFVNAFLPAVEAPDISNPAKPVAVFRIFIPCIRHRCGWLPRPAPRRVLR